MTYNLRPMVISDIEKVMKGEMEVFQETLGYDMFYSELNLNPFAYYFVLEIDESVEGYIGFWIQEEQCEVINFYVSPQYQNLGFGTMMLEFVLELCEMSNVKTMSLEVREHNERAIHLYQKYGFQYSHTRERYYKNLENALVLIKTFEVK